MPGSRPDRYPHFSFVGSGPHIPCSFGGLWWPSEGPDMLDEARHWAETQFGTADLGDARRTHRLVSIMAAIARAPDESLPRQLGSLANTKAGYRLFDCGAVTRTAVMDPHVAHCRAAAARHPIVLMGHDHTILRFAHSAAGRPRHGCVEHPDQDRRGRGLCGLARA